MEKKQTLKPKQLLICKHVKSTYWVIPWRWGIHRGTTTTDMKADSCLFRGPAPGSCTVCASLIEEIQLTNYTASAGESKVTKVWDQVRAGLSNGGTRWEGRGLSRKGAFDISGGWGSRTLTRSDKQIYWPAGGRVNNRYKAWPVVHDVIREPCTVHRRALNVRLRHLAASHPSCWCHDSPKWLGKHKWIMVCQPGHYSTNITKILARVGQNCKRGNPSKNRFNSQMPNLN